MLQLETMTQAIAEAFVGARRAGRALVQYPGTPPTALSEAYAVQDAAIPLFNDTVVGWKVGRINPPWLEELGTSRLVGPIFSTSVQKLESNGQEAEGLIFKDGFGAAEAEFIFRVGTAPSPGQREFSIDDTSALIDTVFCGFEIASSPFPGINDLGPLVTISDFGNNNGLLLGPEIPDWRSAQFDLWDVVTRVDGQEVGSGKADAFPGGTLESVRFLIENLVRRGFPVFPGLLISSGAITGVHRVVAGQFVEAHFGKFSGLRCTIRHCKGE